VEFIGNEGQVQLGDLDGKTATDIERFNDPFYKGGGAIISSRKAPFMVTAAWSSGNYCCNTIRGPLGCAAGGIRINMRGLCKGTYDVSVQYEVALQAAPGGNARALIVPNHQSRVNRINISVDNCSVSRKNVLAYPSAGVSRSVRTLTIPVTVSGPSDNVLLLNYDPTVTTTLAAPFSAYAIAVAGFRVVHIKRR